MSVPGHPDPAKLVVGFFTGRKDLLAPVVRDLEAQLGMVDLVSRWLAFDFTSYYRAEFGELLFRRMASFQQLIRQADLADIKRITNDIELKYSREGKRQINIDPGYLLRERFVLATGKNFAHRIYIGEGIYADLTLLYYDKAFQALPWTYPDYADEKIQSFLTQARSRFIVDLKNHTEKDDGFVKSRNLPCFVTPAPEPGSRENE